MLDWTQLVVKSDEELKRLDLIEVNLACAVGMPGAEKIDVQFCKQRVDYFAKRVRQFTDAGYPQFRRKPSEYRDSYTYFRCLCLITVLQRDLGVRYNPAKIPEHVPFDTEDTFVHGILQGPGGTCATLPVLYAAVGRRLCYPLKLVSALGNHGHLFVRWDDPCGERLNIEGTNRGLNCFPDDYYRTGIYARTAQLEGPCCLLKLMTPREELSGFLGERGIRWKEKGNYRRAVEAFAWAFAVAPHNLGMQDCFGGTMNEWNAWLETIKPPGFPEVEFHWGNFRRLPLCVPEALERGWRLLDAMEGLLTKPEYEQKWWGPMRRGFKPFEYPVRIDVEVTPTGFDFKVSLARRVLVGDMPVQPVQVPAFAGPFVAWVGAGRTQSGQPQSAEKQQ
jgi:hypothetical protein